MIYPQNSPLSIDEWTLRAKKHAELVAPFTDPFLQRRAVHQTHPVHDFLFTYYNCSPLKLKQWVPSFEQSLSMTPEMLKEYRWFKSDWFHLKESVLSFNKEHIFDNTRELTLFIEELCTNILERPPKFGCYGLHEWAMVYKVSSESIRHKGYRLRLSPDNLSQFIESQSICCSHYDAYRFFSKEAHPLNLLNPVLENRLKMEQGGCLHANMDIYKWATKLWPWIGSDFIGKAFLLALECRELDMRASPYDLIKEGYEPICIETEEGRKEYQKQQEILAYRAIPLRIQLQEFCKRFCNYSQPFINKI
jgi:hypothetical protein